MTDLLKTQIPQLIISVLVIIGIFLLLVLHVITADNPVFDLGGGGILALVVGYWLSAGQQRLQHIHTLETLRQAGNAPIPLTTRPTVTDWNRYPGTK